MNERIRELALQAGLYHKVNDNNFYPTNLSTEQSDPTYQKFAELIVRECAGIAKQTATDDGDDYKSGRVWASIDILKYFNVGVEE